MLQHCCSQVSLYINVRSKQTTTITRIFTAIAQYGGKRTYDFIEQHQPQPKRIRLPSDHQHTRASQSPQASETGSSPSATPIGHTRQISGTSSKTSSTSSNSRYVKRDDASR